MKAIAIVAAALTTAVIAEPKQIKPRALFTIETAPGQTVQITEEERWELASVSPQDPPDPTTANNCRMEAAEAISSILRSSMQRSRRSKFRLRILPSSNTRRTSGACSQNSSGTTSGAILRSTRPTTRASLKLSQVLRHRSGFLLRFRMLY